VPCPYPLHDSHWMKTTTIRRASWPTSSPLCRRLRKTRAVFVQGPLWSIMREEKECVGTHRLGLYGQRQQWFCFLSHPDG